jgi:hypothetical protein
MHFNGKKLEALAVGEVHLPRPGDTKENKALVFSVRAIGLGEEAKAARLFPDAKPPSDFVYGKQKGIPLRDPQTNQPLREPNYDDIGYLESQERALRMQMVVQAVDSLDRDPKIVFETQVQKDTAGYYEAAAAELKDAGITLGDVRLVLKKARELGNMDAKKLQEAAESFS